MMLTGPIRMDGVLVGYAAETMPVLAGWDDESVYHEYDSRRREQVAAHYRLRGTFALPVRTPVQVMQLRGLTDEPFLLVLRTRAPGDPVSWPELEIRVRRLGPIEETLPLNLDDLYTVQIEFEALETLQEIPGAIEGGFSLLDTWEENGYTLHDIEPWGDATMTPRTLNLTVDGSPMALTVYDMGPPELVALVMEPDPDNPQFAYWLDTTGVWRLGSPKKDL